MGAPTNRTAPLPSWSVLLCSRRCRYDAAESSGLELLLNLPTVFGIVTRAVR